MIDTGFMEGDKAGLDRFENTIQPTQMRCIARLERLRGSSFRKTSLSRSWWMVRAWVKDALVEPATTGADPTA